MTPILRAAGRQLLGFSLVAASMLVVPSIAHAQFNLRVVQGTDVDTLDPAVSRSVPSYNVSSMIFNTLVSWKDASLSQIVPQLATSWSRSKDGKTWTFKLRTDVKFHDGSVFTAQSVKFNIERILDPAVGSPNRSSFSNITKVTVIDPFTVEITTDQPSPVLLEFMTEPFAAMNSPQAVLKHGRAYSRNPVGTGPYVFSEWVPGQHVILKRNPSYFGKPGKADSMIFRPVPEAGARVIELQSGNADIATYIPPESTEQVKTGKGTKLIVAPSAFQTFIEINTRKPPFNNPKLRLAVNEAIDRKAIIEKILNGYGKMPEGIFPEGVQGRMKLPAYAYNPEKARKAFNEAFPGGYKGKVVLWTPSGRYTKDKSVAEAVQSYLNAIGLETEFKVWEWASYQKTLYNTAAGGMPNPDANLWFLGTGVTNADRRLRRKFLSTDLSNLTGFNNPRVDAILKQASTEMDYAARMKAYGNVQSIVWKEDPNAISLYDNVQLIGTGAGISGLVVFGDETLKLDQVTKQ